MSITGRVITFAFAASLAACATQPIASRTAKRVPPNRVFDSSLLTRSEGKSEVTFIRDAGFLGGGVKARLSVNTRPFAELGAGEAVSIYLTPRIYIFSMIQRPNLFGYEVPREIEVDVKPGRITKIRVGFSEEGPVFAPMTF